jgi:hypothetical protein
MRKTAIGLLMMAAIVAAAISPISATVPTQINYQGYLTDGAGVAVVDNTYSIEFRIYDGVGTELWMESHSVTTSGGQFSVLLGSNGNPITDAVFSADDRFLGIKVGADPELTPRSRLVTAPYAFRVGTVDGASGGTISSLVQLQNGADVTGDVTMSHNLTIGLDNENLGEYCLIAGAYDTIPLGRSNCFVAGTFNKATDTWASVLGGRFNEAGGAASAVLGGTGNLAAGDHSAAAGTRAKAYHNGTFVWGDNHLIDFGSTGENQFLIRAGGGVGIGTNDPSEQLEVNGTVYSTSGGFRFPDGTLQSTAASSGAPSGWADDGTVVRLETATDNVGIGTSGPAAKLDVNGDVRFGQEVGAGSGDRVISLVTYPGSDVHRIAARNSYLSIEPASGPTGDPENLVLIPGGGGNVGIGITGPSEKLQVNGTVHSLTGGFRFPDGTMQTTAASSGAPSGWADDGNYVRLETTNDSVGIGTDTPTEKLDVTGNIHASGTITSGSSITIDGDAGEITSTSGTISFGNEKLATTGSGSFGSGNTVGTSGFATGFMNTASGGNSFASGNNNDASGSNTAVCGGWYNTATNSYSAILGGREGVASGQESVIIGGEDNVASGDESTVLGGFRNSATGHGSIAAGRLAKSKHYGSVVIAAHYFGSYGDSIYTTHDQQMVLRADDYFYFTDAGGAAPYVSNRFINTSTGAFLTTGGTWQNSSDRSKKENFTEVDGEELLELVAKLPITRWNYKAEDASVTHIGPVAQDFHALFGVGGDDKSISTVDPAGIALAAIQALHEKTREIDLLKSEVEQLRSEKDAQIDELKLELGQITGVLETILAERNGPGATVDLASN